jgi:hypothetical protein
MPDAVILVAWLLLRGLGLAGEVWAFPVLSAGSAS